MYAPQHHILFSSLLKYVRVLPFDVQILISEKYVHNEVCYILFCIFPLPKLDKKTKHINQRSFQIHFLQMSMQCSYNFTSYI